jgi:hypothetical protein
VIKRFFERYQLTSTNRTQREYSPSAQVFLSKYSAEYEISDLSPTQFAFGFVVAYITELGWSRENFIKEPNGGEPGEILGADIAILREYSQARHGSRSTTATFARNMSGQPPTNLSVSWQIASQYMTGIDVLNLQ